MARNILRDKVSLSVCVESDLHHFKTFLLQFNGLKETIKFICVSVHFYSGFATCACAVFSMCRSTSNSLDKGECSSKHYFLSIMGKIQTWHLVLVTLVPSFLRILEWATTAFLYEGSEAALIGR